MSVETLWRDLPIELLFFVHFALLYKLSSRGFFLEAFCGKSPAATLPPLSSPSSGVDAHDFASSLPMNLKTDSSQLPQELAAWV